MANGDSGARWRLTLRVEQRGESERELGTEYWRFVVVVAIDGVEDVNIAS